MYIASQWLDGYEGAKDAEACRRVAEWLKAQAEKKELRDVAREAGVPVAKAPAAINKAAARG
jgi:urease accessory protein UreF